MEMQAADEESQAKSRSDEDSINFRPSPNFKHMKKYLKSKFEEAMMMEALCSRGEPSAALGHNKREKVNNPTYATAPVQPPLPPNPPPPDSPPMIKKEIIDDEYQCNATETPSEFNQSDELNAVTIKTDQSETSSEKPNVTMCRNFARGTCKKGAACIFAHELILSQLPGVYTFCRNFQNSVCSFPKCKFVHATVFEKEYFFRTGYLPPHTLAHLKETTVVQPPPPPPQPEEKAAEVPPVYTNAPPPPSIPCIPPAVVPYVENGVDRSGPNIFRSMHSTPDTTSPKREWSEIQEVSSSTLDLDSGENLPKKCKKCDSLELSEQLLKAGVEKLRRTKKELIQKTAELDRKNAIVAVVLGSLLKSPTKSLSATNGLSSITGNKDDSLLSNPNFTALLAKMLLERKSGVQPDAP